MRTRSGSLLRNVIERGDITREGIAAELSLTADDIDEIIAGTQAMSPTHQLCLAAFLIERVPRLARQGHALRGQVGATIAFNEQNTKSHSGSHVSWRGTKGA